MTETHPPTGNPENPSVRYERSDAQPRGVVIFGLALAAGCAILAALLWWMYTASIYVENAAKRSESPWGAADRAGAAQEQRGSPRPTDPGTEHSGFDPNPRLDGLNVPSLEHDVGRIRPGTAQEQAAEQEKHLAEAGWLDRDRGVVHMPIEQAMKKLAGKLPARADGVAADEFLQAPTRSSSGRLPRGGKE
jgi:hypothetical protein